jgi:hypothetical protein
MTQLGHSPNTSGLRFSSGRRGVRWIYLGLGLTLLAPPAHAAPPFAFAHTLTPAAPAKKAAPKPVAQVAAPAAKPAVEPSVRESDESRVARLLASVRKALAAAAKPDEPAPLADAMVGAILNVSVVNVLHGHFALAGVGQALRAGGMSGEVAQEFARNMRDGWRALANDFQRLADQKAFDAELRDLFRTLATLAQRGEGAAGKLAEWAAQSADTGRAAAFEAALEDYRGRAAALLGALKK